VNAAAHFVRRRSARWGIIAAAGIAAFYAVIVAAASGSLDHLADQIRQDWYLLVAIVTGFGIQVALVLELRDRHRLSHGAIGAGGAGTGGSALGMVACCAHHLVELLPVLGATGVAAFLVDWRVPFMVAGIAVNALSIAAAVRRLRQADHGQTGSDCECALA
jgi:hypothetical protein